MNSTQKTEHQVADLVSYEEDSVKSVKRFQALQAGQYWRAQRDIAEQEIDSGTVLLIESIRWVDDAPHTIILRPHPLKIKEFDEHRFLLNDFLCSFEFEPEHLAIRTSEVRSLQNRITELQSELVATQSDPVLLAKVVEEGFREKAKNPPDSLEADTDPHHKTSVVPIAPNSSHLVTLANGSVSDAIGNGITAEKISALKDAANREHQIATIKAEWIQGKTTAIAQTIKAMTPFYEEQAAAALAQTEDVRTYVAKLLQGIESLDLYVGKDVEVQRVRQGEDAAKDIPLTFVQKKLLMDEELAVWTDLDEWFDFSNENRFFDALRQHDGLVNQIFPTERCVLVMAVTRRHIDYGDGLANLHRNKENAKVFLLVRNGMNIHRVFSPVESHLGSARLFPTNDDQDNVFRGLDGTKIKFEDVAYTDALNKHEKFALHYKRFLLLTCGLDHRLKLFGDFYEGPPSFDFVSLGFQERFCRFLYDDEPSMLLPGLDKPSVAAWIAERNAYMRSGSRVLCNWEETMNPDTAPSACKAYRGNHGFDRRYTPKEKFSVPIAFKDGEDICVEVLVSGYSVGLHDSRSYNCKVNLSKFKGNDWHNTDLPFLCLDAVEPSDLHWYIKHRDSRKDHLSYIRFFKQALKHILSERSDEQESRDRLKQALAEGKVCAPADRDALVSQAVIAWRAANRGKPLPCFGSSPSSAPWKSLLNQMFMLAGEGNRRVSEVEDFVLELGLIPLRLVLSGGAKLVVYAAANPQEFDDRLERHAWVHRITVERGKTKFTEKSRRWTLLPKHAASETTLHQWDGAEQWADRSSVFPSFERKTEIMAQCSMFSGVLKQFTSKMSEGDHLSHFNDWLHSRTKILDKSKFVRDPLMAIPFGLAYYPRANELRLLCIGHHKPHALMAHQAPSEVALQRIRASFVEPFNSKVVGIQRFQESMEKVEDWKLLDMPVKLIDNRDAIYYPKDVDINDLTNKPHSPLLADWFSSWESKSKEYSRIWVADEALDQDGRLALDKLLGISLPHDYEPVRVRDIRLTNTSPLPKYHHWLDLCPDAESPKQSVTFMSNDPEIQNLIRGVKVDGNSGYISTSKVFLSRQEARSAIQKWLSSPYRLISSSDLPDAPKPCSMRLRFSRDMA